MARSTQGQRNWLRWIGEALMVIGLVSGVSGGLSWLISTGATAADAKRGVDRHEDAIEKLQGDVAYTRGRVDAIADRLNVPPPEKK